MIGYIQKCAQLLLSVVQAEVFLSHMGSYSVVTSSPGLGMSGLQKGWQRKYSLQTYFYLLALPLMIDSVSSTCMVKGQNIYVFTDWINQELCVISPSKLCFTRPPFQLTLLQRNSLLNNRHSQSIFGLSFTVSQFSHTALSFTFFFYFVRKFSFSFLPKILLVINTGKVCLSI